MKRSCVASAPYWPVMVQSWYDVITLYLPQTDIPRIIDYFFEMSPNRGRGAVIFGQRMVADSCLQMDFIVCEGDFHLNGQWFWHVQRCGQSTAECLNPCFNHSPHPFLLLLPKDIIINGILETHLLLFVFEAGFGNLLCSFATSIKDTSVLCLPPFNDFHAFKLWRIRRHSSPLIHEVIPFDTCDSECWTMGMSRSLLKLL